MRKLHYPKIRRAIAAGLVVLGFAGAAQAELIVGLTTQNQLISFDSATPGTINAGGVVMGLTTGDELVGIDFRPSLGPNNGVLYAVGINRTDGSGRIYTLNTTTGAATLVSTLAADPADGTSAVSVFDRDRRSLRRGFQSNGRPPARRQR